MHLDVWIYLNCHNYTDWDTGMPVHTSMCMVYTGIYQSVQCTYMYILVYWYHDTFFICLFSCWLAAWKRLNSCMNAFDWPMPTDMLVHPRLFIWDSESLFALSALWRQVAAAGGRGGCGVNGGDGGGGEGKRLLSGRNRRQSSVQQWFSSGYYVVVPAPLYTLSTYSTVYTPLYKEVHSNCHTSRERRHVLCFVEAAGFEPRTYILYT